jgi:hypothetical protein
LFNLSQLFMPYVIAGWILIQLNFHCHHTCKQLSLSLAEYKYRTKYCEISYIYLL